MEQAWSALSNVTGLPLTTELFLKSREKQTAQLIDGLVGRGSILRVKALSEREAYGFILASLKSSDELSARLLIVKNQVTWDQLVDFKNSLVLTPFEFKPGNIGNAVSNGHNVVLALDNLDFTGKQELLRLLVEKVFYDGQSIEILTIIPLSEQLHPIHRGGHRG